MEDSSGWKRIEGDFGKFWLIMEIPPPQCPSFPFIPLIPKQALRRNDFYLKGHAINGMKQSMEGWGCFFSRKKLDVCGRGMRIGYGISQGRCMRAARGLGAVGNDTYLGTRSCSFRNTSKWTEGVYLRLLGRTIYRVSTTILWYFF
jgi:hypothetical protein